MDTAFTLTTECIQKFIDVKCLKDIVKNDHNDEDEDSDAESDTDHQAEEVLAAWQNRFDFDVQREENFDISLLDEDKMMTHMMDCYAALCTAQQYRVEKKQPSKLDAKTQQAKNKVFKTAMSLVSTGMTHDGSEKLEYSSALSKMITTSISTDECVSIASVFPDDSKQTDGRGWMPLHLAALAFDTHEGNLHGLTEEDVQLIYANDPLALQRYHKYNEEDIEGEDVEGSCSGIQRYTPVHFLCMQPVTRKRTSLLRYFSICNRQAHFIPSVLHVTCQLGQPTEELLKFLLQLDSSQTAKFYCDNDHNEHTPLGHLCYNNSSCNERLMACLLDVDSSTGVIRDGFMSCFASIDHSNMLIKFDVLSKYADWDAEESLINQLLHTVLNWRSISSSLCIGVIQRFLAIRPNVVKEMYDGCLPVHVAAKRSSMEVMEFLLGLYPESAKIVTVNENFLGRRDGSSNNLLHVAVSEGGYNSIKVGYLCSRYPEMIHQRNSKGETPLHLALGCFNAGVLTAKILCEVGGQEVVKTPVVHPTDRTDHLNGWLPLHFLMQSRLLCSSSPLSKEADFFRLMLRWYHEAGIAAGGRRRFKPTPYQLAVNRKLDPYFLRLLLRAAPNVNPAELHRLNYAERRMAMFLAFRAAASVTKPLLMARLRFENKDLVKHVVSFL